MKLNDFLCRCCRSESAKRTHGHAPQSPFSHWGILPFPSQQRQPSSSDGHLHSRLYTDSWTHFDRHRNPHRPLCSTDFDFPSISSQIPRTLSTRTASKVNKGWIFVRHTSWTCATQPAGHLPPTPSQSFQLSKYLSDAHETIERFLGCSCCFYVVLLLLSSCIHDPASFRTALNNVSIRCISRG
jgi:hypothetical protein